MASGRAEDLLLALAGAPAPSNLAPGEPAAPPPTQGAPAHDPAQTLESAARGTARDAAPGAFAATRPAPSGYPADGSPPFSRQKLYHEPPPPSLPSQMHQVQPIAHAQPVAETDATADPACFFSNTCTAGFLSLLY